MRGGDKVDDRDISYYVIRTFLYDINTILGQQCLVFEC